VGQQGAQVTRLPLYYGGLLIAASLISIGLEIAGFKHWLIIALEWSALPGALLLCASLDHLDNTTPKN
jgi:hypothetical protein